MTSFFALLRRLLSRATPQPVVPKMIVTDWGVNSYASWDRTKWEEYHLLWGYSQIRSWAQAMQLTRRMLKCEIANAQRWKSKPKSDDLRVPISFHYLEQVKPGNWHKLRSTGWIDIVVSPWGKHYRREMGLTSRRRTE